MERRALGIVAIILIGLMALVATAGLDNLPPRLRASVDAAGALLNQDRSAFDENRKRIENAIRDEPALFKNEAEPWRARLDRDRGQLDAAAAKLASVQQLAKANRRTDEYYVEVGLGDFNSQRQEALRDEANLNAEAERWLTAKRTLPGRIRAMRTSYDALEAVDAEAPTAPIRKAIADWPEKRDDLQTRLTSLQQLKTQGQQIWDSSSALRSAAEANNLADSDYEVLLSQADRLDTTASQAKESLAATTALAAQLYVSWDKLLLDADQGREKVRIVGTHFPDAKLAHGETSSEERWESADSRDAEEQVGMVVEHKAAGKYDSEPDRSPQPPTYAYIAPPGQSNNYGSWTAGVWHWLPEYLILSQLLRAPRYPVTMPDYEAYQSARRRGDVFYGRNNEYLPHWPNRAPSAPSYSRPPPLPGPVGNSPTGGPTGGWYSERPQARTPASPPLPPSADHSYSASPYRSHGTYSGSRYQSRGSFGSSSASRAPTRSYSGSRGGRR